MEGLAGGTRTAPPPCWKRRAGEAAMLGRSALRRRWQGGSFSSPAASQASAAALLLTLHPFPGSPPQPPSGKARLGPRDPSCPQGQGLPCRLPPSRHVPASPQGPGHLLRQGARRGWPSRERRGDPSLKDSRCLFCHGGEEGREPLVLLEPFPVGVRMSGQVVVLLSCGVTLLL